MGCPQEQWVDNAEFLRRFNAKARQERIPLHGGLDLTYRCNLRCVHCYAGPASGISRQGPSELGTNEVMSIIDQVVDAGCLFLLITGGDPLIRKDFPDVYRHARKCGLLVTVFTNGTLMDAATMAAFEEYPPNGVEISIYGSKAETHDRITGVSGSWEQAMKTVRLLNERGVRVLIKTVLMTLNKDELGGMERLARDLGIKFRFDAAICARLSGDAEPLKVRLSPAEAVGSEFSDSARMESWRKHAARSEGHMVASRFLYTCGAGLCGFHIDPYGNLFPCLMARSVRHDLRKGSFLEGWRNVIPSIRDELVAADYPCNACDNRVHCSSCPATFLLESAGRDRYFDFMCGVAKERADFLRG